MARNYLNLEYLVYEQNLGTENAYLKSVVNLLFCCKALRSLFYNCKLSQQKCEQKECLLCIISNIYANLWKYPNLSSLCVKLNVILAKKGIVHTSNSVDAMKIIEIILNAFHCQHIKDFSEGTNDEAIQECCAYECYSHKIFGLRIAEIYSCKCETSFEISWKGSNFFQHLNIADIFSKVDYESSINLLNLPKFMIDEEIPSASSKIKGQMIKILQKKLENAHVNFCSYEDCKEKSSNVNFQLKNLPEAYIINVVWESNDVGYLDCFLSAISITGSFLMSEIYLSNEKQNYSLNGILLSNGRDHEYAYFEGKSCNFTVDKEKFTSWIELIIKIIIKKYYPIGLVYEKSNGPFELSISNLKMKALEKIACKYDHFSLKYPDIPISDYLKKDLIKISKLNESDIFRKTEPKQIEKTASSQKPPLTPPASVVIQEKQNETKLKTLYALNPDNSDKKGEAKLQDNAPESSRSALHKEYLKNQLGQSSNKWKCECGKENELDWNICQKCKKIKPGVTGWVCKICTFFNKERIYNCEGCGQYNSTEIKWQCFICGKFNKSSQNKCYYCNTLNNTSSTKAKESSTISWTANKDKLSDQKNANELIASSQTKEVNRYGIPCTTPEKAANLGKSETWLCNNCHTFNKQIENKCKDCYRERKDKVPIEEQKVENQNKKWVCTECKMSHYNSLNICTSCRTAHTIIKGDVSSLKTVEENNSKSSDLSPLDPKKNDGTKTSEENKITHLICNICKQENSSILRECFKCNSKKNIINNLSNLTENDDIGESDSEDNPSKEQKKSNLNETKSWECLSCKKSNSADRFICYYCDIPKGSGKSAWICGNCKKVNQTHSKNCFYCSKLMFKLVKKICDRCDNMIYHPEIRCEKCKNIQKNTADTWECQSCKTKNEISKNICLSCNAAKILKEEVSKSSESSRPPKCSKCNQPILFLFCSKCMKETQYAERCLDCKSFIVDIITCYACKYKSPLYYQKYS